jgi:hypothetical protein
MRRRRLSSEEFDISDRGSCESSLSLAGDFTANRRTRVAMCVGAWLLICMAFAIQTYSCRPVYFATPKLRYNLARDYLLRGPTFGMYHAEDWFR